MSKPQKIHNDENQSLGARAKRFRASVFVVSIVFGAVAYVVANALAPDFRDLNLWFGYLLLAPLCGLVGGALVHWFARAQELYVAAGFGFGVGNLLASGALALPTAGLSVAGNLVMTAALVGLAFGLGWAFGPAAAALAQTVLGGNE